MKKEEKEKYLGQCSVCFLCQKESEELTLLHTVVELEKPPWYVGPTLDHYYPVCPECKSIGELV